MIPFLVKRHGRSPLFDTAEGRFVTVDDPRLWKEGGLALYVEDVETGEGVSLILLAYRRLLGREGLACPRL